jgi:hypothetical protein
MKPLWSILKNMMTPPLLQVAQEVGEMEVEEIAVKYVLANVEEVAAHEALPVPLTVALTSKLSQALAV